MEKQKITIPDGMTAKDIEQQYDVSHSTAWRASKRGWLYEHYHGDQSAPAVKEGILQKFRRLIDNETINVSQLTCLKKQKIWDIYKGTSTLREDDWHRFKAEWVEIRNLIRRLAKSPYERNLRAIVSDARIKKHLLFKDKRMLDRLRKEMNITDRELQAARRKAKDFLNKTVI
jgi:hypothetical protein